MFAAGCEKQRFQNLEPLGSSILFGIIVVHHQLFNFAHTHLQVTVIAPCDWSPSATPCIESVMCIVYMRWCGD